MMCSTQGFLRQAARLPPHLSPNSSATGRTRHGGCSLAMGTCSGSTRPCGQLLLLLLVAAFCRAAAGLLLLLLAVSRVLHNDINGICRKEVGAA